MPRNSEDRFKISNNPKKKRNRVSFLPVHEVINAFKTSNKRRVKEEKELHPFCADIRNKKLFNDLFPSVPQMIGCRQMQHPDQV
ncbi:hypothetical protein RUM43_009798 [Polyplax serrata]|uniref:Uncharacterized protein n=1 Tax=Polyplax serrata TaxID=468196 RepID=A0AAN8S6W9_POLSC